MSPKSPPKNPRPPQDPVGEEREDDGAAAVEDALSPAMPAVGTAAMLEADPRLNRKSETEAELDALVHAEEEAEAERAQTSEAAKGK